ncbi:MAG: hypothetical protein Q8P24_05990 [Desulfobacterales bacterium]|nr:hypothetical protein [Desulfobacterales bacterium]
MPTWWRVSEKHKKINFGRPEMKADKSAASREAGICRKCYGWVTVKIQRIKPDGSLQEDRPSDIRRAREKILAR